jgi:hypothetical protein
MTDTTPASLVFVAETSLADLRQHLRHLQTAPSKTVPNLLKQIKEVCDVLSQSLSKLSAYTDTLERDERTNSAPEADRGLLLAALELGRAVEHGFCTCGGVSRG